MSTSPPEGHRGPTVKGSETPTGKMGVSSESLTTLRGSSVGRVDGRRVVQVLLVLCLLTLAPLVVVFSIAGAHHNDQISRLHSRGVPADMTVTSCTILPGGTGSNDAGHSCRGTFTLDGHRYTEAIPGIERYSRGDSLHIVVVRSDPALLALAHTVKTTHSSWTAFVLPGILFLALVATLVGLVVERRRGSNNSANAVAGSGDVKRARD